MEPVSTIILVASMFAGAATTRTRLESFSTEPQNFACELLNLQEKNTYISTPTVPAVDVSALPVISAKEGLYNQLASYLPGHKNSHATIKSSGDDVFAALKIIQRLPTHFPLPTLMRNDEGEIGMYWDNGDIYLDIEIENDDLISLFSRARSTGKETFLSDISIEKITTDWLDENLASFIDLMPNDNSYALAA